MILDQDEGNREPAGDIWKLEERDRELEKEVRLLQHNNLQLGKERGSLSKTAQEAVKEALANQKIANDQNEQNKYLIWKNAQLQLQIDTMRPALDMPQLQLELEASVRAHNGTKVEPMKARRLLGEQI